MPHDNIMDARLRLVIPLSLLVILSPSCSLVTNLFSPQAEGATVPGTAAPPAQPPLANGSVEFATPTVGVRRKVLPPTPTPFAVTSQDDVRSILDLSQLTYVD